MAFVLVECAVEQQECSIELAEMEDILYEYFSSAVVEAGD